MCGVAAVVGSTVDWRALLPALALTCAVAATFARCSARSGSAGFAATAAALPGGGGTVVFSGVIALIGEVVRIGVRYIFASFRR